MFFFQFVLDAMRPEDTTVQRVEGISEVPFRKFLTDTSFDISSIRSERSEIRRITVADNNQ